MVRAVNWLPRLVEEADEARDLLKRARSHVDDPELSDAIDVMLAKPTVRDEEPGDGGWGAYAASKGTPVR